MSNQRKDQSSSLNSTYNVEANVTIKNLNNEAHPERTDSSQVEEENKNKKEKYFELLISQFKENEKSISANFTSAINYSVIAIAALFVFNGAKGQLIPGSAKYIAFGVFIPVCILMIHAYYQIVLLKRNKDLGEKIKDIIGESDISDTLATSSDDNYFTWFVTASWFLMFAFSVGESYLLSVSTHKDNLPIKLGWLAVIGSLIYLFALFVLMYIRNKESNINNPIKNVFKNRGLKWFASFLVLVVLPFGVILLRWLKIFKGF